MENARTTSPLLASFLTVVFVAMMVLSGCTSSDLVGPKAPSGETEVEMTRTDPGNAAHNEDQDGTNSYHSAGHNVAPDSE